MSKKNKESDWRQELEQIAEKLRDPLRMRVAVALVMVCAMFFMISEPLHGRTKKTRRELNQFREQVRTAQEVELLQVAFQHIDSKVFQQEGNDQVTKFLIDLFRETPVDLLLINAEAPQRLGPLYSVRVKMDFAGEFSELNAALFLLESQNELVRVESVQIKPAERGSALPTMQLTIRMLKEKQ